MTIHGQMTIGECLRLHPATAAVFRRYGMECTSCQGIHSETIAAGAINHGIPPDQLVAALNRSLAGSDTGG
jgi:hybrid cluster-associated redox disulfide protein